MSYFTGYETMKYGASFYDCVDRSEKIIIYGAGNICRQFLSLFEVRLKEKLIGIAVTSMSGNDAVINGIRVGTLDKFLNDLDATVIIAINGEEIVKGIRKELKHKNFKKILAVDFEKLNFYRVLREIPRSNMYLGMDSSCSLPEETELLEKELNIGKFLGSEELRETQGIKFNTLSMVWGGSSLLDYALLRGLVIKYQIETYLEIGTYIGDSLTVVSDLVKKCYSITVPEDHPAHMRNWCHRNHTIDYSNKLVTGDNMIQYQEDSKEFDFGKINGSIGLYFIDGDHSYQGVLIDSLKVLEHFDPENSFVVWHDCRNSAGKIDLEVVGAIYEATGDEYFKNFFIFNNSMCGVYIPDKYINDFVKTMESDKLVTYQVVLEKNEGEL